MWRTGLIAVLIAASACGGDDKAKFYQPPGDGKDSGADDSGNGGGGGKAGKGGKGGGGGATAGKGGSDADASTDAAMPDDNGPELAFTMPDAASNPNDDTVVTSAMVTVRCQAKQREGQAKVNESTVSITIDDEEGSKTTQPATTQVSGSNEDFEAKFDVSMRKNGKLTFQCTASDTASAPLKSTISMDTLLDLGPAIDLQEPKDMSIHALKTPVTIKFQVDPQPIADGDSEADVKGVKLLIGGIEHEVTEAQDKPGLYQTSIDFNDKTQFMVAPQNSEIMVKATNGRSPDAATRTVKSDITIDGSGPAISIDSPTAGSIVHGEVTLKLTVTDASGLMAGTLNAAINDTLLKFSDWKMTSATTFEHTFDTRKFSLELTQITINVAATDIVGNQTDPPASISLRLDNRPPLIALDPPPLREWRKSGTNTYCSASFDPVGTSARGDLSTSTATGYFRALVVDQTNHSPGSMLDYIAGVANEKVVLYAQPDPTIPLLIDKDGDTNHYCDEVNFADLPEAKRPTIIKLSALVPRGSSFYSNPIDYSGSFCTADPSSTNVFPDSICPDGSTEMFRAVAAPQEGVVPAVYAYMPTNGSAGECEGIGWEVLSIVHEGWRCLAVRAEDNIGNVGISEAIRVCFNDNNSSNGTPDCSPGAAPSCTSSCTISDDQKFPTGMIWQAK